MKPPAAFRSETQMPKLENKYCWDSTAPMWHQKSLLSLSHKTWCCVMILLKVYNTAWLTTRFHKSLCNGFNALRWHNLINLRKTIRHLLKPIWRSIIHGLVQFSHIVLLNNLQYWKLTQSVWEGPVHKVVEHIAQLLAMSKTEMQEWRWWSVRVQWAKMER